MTLFMKIYDFILKVIFFLTVTLMFRRVLFVGYYTVTTVVS